MALRTLALVLTFVGSALAAPVPKELKVSSDAQRIQGVWLANDAEGFRWYFDGDKLSVGGKNTTDDKGLTYAFVLRPSATPSECDFGGGDKIQYYAIYTFVGDDLRIAYSSGRERPKDFSSGPGVYVHVLKRIPEAKK